MKADYLYGTEFSVIQEKGMYHFNSDTEFLGRFLRLLHKDHVLEIGCNNGALLLYAAAQKPASLTGIDLFPEVIETARKNMERNGVSAELEVCRAQDYRHEQFDVIICNPPFFRTENEDLKNRNRYLAAARHETNLRPEELFAAVRRLIKDNGRFYMAHRASRITDMIMTAEKYNMHPVRMKIAYEAHGKKGKTAVFEFRSGPSADLTVEPAAFMDDRDTFADPEGETV